MAKTTSKSTSDKVKVLNKNGRFVSHTERFKAEFSVKQDKSEWIDSDTIQIKYHHKDLQAFKKEVWIRDNYTCYVCEKKMHESHPSLTVDHIVPKRLGGSVLPKNMACCCKECNEEKGHRTYEQYFLHLYLGLSFMILWWRSKRIEEDIVHGYTTEREKERVSSV